MKIYCLMYHEFHCQDEVIKVYTDKNKAEHERNRLFEKEIKGQVTCGCPKECFENYEVTEHEVIE